MASITREDVVNHSGEVVTEDGRRLYGIDAENYSKMKAKMNPEWNKKVIEWIEGMVGHKLEDEENLYVSLKSGIVLCELANKIRSNIIPKYNTIGRNGEKELHNLQAMENINLYLRACQKLGLKNSDMFVASDLFHSKCMPQVLHNIYALARKCASLGIEGTGSTPSLAPASARRHTSQLLLPKEEPKKWQPVRTEHTYVHVDSLPNRSPNTSPKLTPTPKESFKENDVSPTELEKLKKKTNKLEEKTKKQETEITELKKELSSTKDTLTVFIAKMQIVGAVTILGGLIGLGLFLLKRR